MAYDFGASENNYLARASSLISATDARPITVAFKLKQDSINARFGAYSQWIWSNTGQVSGGDPRLGIAVSSNGTTNEMCWYSEGPGLLVSDAYTPDLNWHSYVLTWAAGGAITIYRDTTDITNATTGTPSAGNTTAGSKIGWIGLAASGFNIDGALEEWAVWNIILTQAEAQQYAGGTPPTSIQAGSLVSYLPLVSDPNDDTILGVNAWTVNGTLTLVDGPEPTPPDYTQTKFRVYNDDGRLL